MPPSGMQPGFLQHVVLGHDSQGSSGARRGIPMLASHDMHVSRVRFQDWRVTAPSPPGMAARRSWRG